MNLEELVLASGFSICKVTGAWSGGVSCRRELEKFAELVREGAFEEMRQARAIIAEHRTTLIALKDR